MTVIDYPDAWTGIAQTSWPNQPGVESPAARRQREQVEAGERYDEHVAAVRREILAERRRKLQPQLDRVGVAIAIAERQLAAAETRARGALEGALINDLAEKARALALRRAAQAFAAANGYDRVLATLRRELAELEQQLEGA